MQREPLKVTSPQEKVWAYGEVGRLQEVGHWALPTMPHWFVCGTQVCLGVGNLLLFGV